MDLWFYIMPIDRLTYALNLIVVYFRVFLPRKQPKIRRKIWGTDKVSTFESKFKTRYFCPRDSWPMPVRNAIRGTQECARMHSTDQSIPDALLHKWHMSVNLGILTPNGPCSFKLNPDKSRSISTFLNPNSSAFSQNPAGDTQTKV